MEVKDVVGFKRRVGFQLRPPISVLRLRRQEVIPAAGDGLFRLDSRSLLRAVAVPSELDSMGTLARRFASGVIYSVPQVMHALAASPLLAKPLRKHQVVATPITIPQSQGMN